MALSDAIPSPDTDLTTVAQWEAFLVGAVGGASGVIPGVGNEFVPTLNTGGRAAVLGTGSAVVRGFYTTGTSTTSTSIGSASGQDRIDRLVLRLDRSQSGGANWVKPVIIAGTPSASPTVPALQTSTSGSWDLPIARWTSASSGGLTGLVDERYWIAGQTVYIKSTARPAASPPRLGIETDTHRVLVSDGSSWTDVNAAQDTGLSPLTLSSSFVQGSITLDVGSINGIAYLTGSCANPSSIATEKKIANIPAAYQPRKSVEVLVYQDGGALLLARAYASGTRSGQLWLIGNLANANGGATIRVNASWPLAS